MKRAVRSAVLVLLLSSAMTLSACSAGQVTQTATQVRDKTGGSAQTGDLTIRAVQVVHPPGGVHPVGGSAEVTMAIVNRGQVEDRLVDVTGPAFGGVVAGVVPAPTAPAVTPDSASPPATDPVGSSALAAGAPVSETTAVDIPIPAAQVVFIGTNGSTLVLDELARPIDAAQSVQLTLTFARAGQTTVTAVMEPPPSVLPRSPVVEF